MSRKPPSPPSVPFVTVLRDIRLLNRLVVMKDSAWTVAIKCFLQAQQDLRLCRSFPMLLQLLATLRAPVIKAALGVIRNSALLRANLMELTQVGFSLTYCLIAANFLLVLRIHRCIAGGHRERGNSSFSYSRHTWPSGSDYS